MSRRHADERDNVMPNRSAKSGRYITNAAAARHPRASVREAPGPNRSTTTVHPQRRHGPLRHRRHRQAEPRWHGHRKRLTSLHHEHPLGGGRLH